MKNFVTLTLCVLFCTVLTSVDLFGQCVSNDPTDRGIVPTTVAGNNIQGTGCGRVNDPGSEVTLLNGLLTITIVNTDCGEVVSWSASGGLVIDAFIVKGGNDHNVYDYAGTGYDSDGNLHSPVNPQNGKFPAVSHYDFCYHYELTVSKTATGTYTRQYDWAITKECLGGSSINLAVGATVNYPFKWTATNTGYTDSDIKVVGTITIENNTPTSATVTSIADVLSDGTGASVTGCPTPFTLAPGESKNCDYEASPDDVSAGVNTVTVTTNSSVVLGNEATANYAFGSPTTEIDKCITVTDNCQSGSTTVCVSQSPYSQSYDCTIGPYLCSANETYTNTVSFTTNDTGASGSDECSVNVTTPKCKLTVSKTANTYYTKTYLWDIDKNCTDGSELTLSGGQVFNYNFNWVAKLTGQPISDIKVTGVITISNGSHLSATVSSITDQLVSGAIATISGCPVPFDLGPGESIDCDYEALPAGISSGTNNVTVTTSTPNVLGNTASRAYSFGSPTTEVDKCITVMDNCVPGSVTVCASQAPYTKLYTCAIGPYPCDTRETYSNSVSFVTSNTAQTGSAECSVSITVPECGTGCTLTQGYWKTHSSKGPARPVDPTWSSVGGPDAGFYSSGKTWYQVLWTPPSGNAYYVLAHQFIAATLNINNGASTTNEVDACMAFAANFFSTKSPSTRLSRTERTQVLACASTLDSYNNGGIGPGHCDEDGSSGYSLPKVDRPLATNIQSNDFKLRLSPNPATSEVQINLSSFIGMNVEVKLTDRLGRTVLVQKLDNLEISTYNLQLNALSIPTGIYQVTVRSNELLLTEPLVIQSDK